VSLSIYEIAARIFLLLKIITSAHSLVGDPTINSNKINKPWCIQNRRQYIRKQIHAVSCQMVIKNKHGDNITLKITMQDKPLKVSFNIRESLK